LGTHLPRNSCFAKPRRLHGVRETEFRGMAFPNRVWERGLGDQPLRKTDPMRKILYPFFFLLLVALPGLGQVQSTKPADVADGFTPDADKVLRYGKGYRYPQQGWIVVHVEGEPYERGYQQGRLLAPEIAGHLKCF